MFLLHSRDPWFSKKISIFCLLGSYTIKINRQNAYCLSDRFSCVIVVYKIPYRRAPRLACRPSALREQRYLAYKCYRDPSFPKFPVTSLPLCLILFKMIAIIHPNLYHFRQNGHIVKRCHIFSSKSSSKCPKVALW